jgi:hypothetical protein
MNTRSTLFASEQNLAGRRIGSCSAALADLDQGEFTEGGVACVSNLVPKSATSDGDNAKGELWAKVGDGIRR